jgi:iron complex transport system substrate-binding protein
MLIIPSRSKKVESVAPASCSQSLGQARMFHPIFCIEGRVFCVKGARMLIRRSASALLLMLALILSGCGASTPPAAQAPTISPATAAPTAAPTTTAPTVAPATAAPIAASTPAATGITITDVAGRTVAIAATPERLISLAPSTTEILFAIGLASKLVAADDFSDYPAEAKSLPKIGGSNGTYNFEQIVALKPGLIFAAGITAPEAITKLEALKLPVVVVGVFLPILRW